MPSMQFSATLTVLSFHFLLLLLLLVRGNNPLENAFPTYVVHFLQLRASRSLLLPSSSSSSFPFRFLDDASADGFRPRLLDEPTSVMVFDDDVVVKLEPVMGAPIAAPPLVAIDSVSEFNTDM
jgi:hypothetical protein